MIKVFQRSLGQWIEKGSLCSICKLRFIILSKSNILLCLSICELYVTKQACPFVLPYAAFFARGSENRSRSTVSLWVLIGIKWTLTSRVQWWTKHMISLFPLVPKPHKSQSKMTFKGPLIPNDGKERRGGTGRSLAPEGGGPGTPALGEESPQRPRPRTSPAHAPASWWWWAWERDGPLWDWDQGPNQGARVSLPSIHGWATALPWPRCALQVGSLETRARVSTDSHWAWATPAPSRKQRGTWLCSWQKPMAQTPCPTAPSSPLRTPAPRPSPPRRGPQGLSLGTLTSPKGRTERP